MSTPIADDERAPAWCDYFTPEEYFAFQEAVQDAASCYGADDIDVDGGSIEMVVGDTHQEGWLQLDALAAQCRDSPRDDWNSLCSDRVFDWVEGRLHRKWLVETPFDEVEELLRPWRLTDEPEILYENGRPDDPAEPVSIPVAGGLYLSLIADVPDLDQASESAVLVPNAAVQAWQRSPGQLLELVKRRLRELPPPTWVPYTMGITNSRGPAKVEIHFGVVDPAAGDIPVTAWFLLLDEVFPFGDASPEQLRRGAFVVLPERNSLIVAVNEKREIAGDQPWALFSATNRRYGIADDDDRGSRQLFIFGRNSPRVVPWPESWLERR